jgi:hypothetical protein
METAIQLPRHWLIVGGVLVLLSMFDVARVAEGGLSFAFRITNTTAILVALIWLPALIKLFALVGGEVRTPAGEMTSPGVAGLCQRLWEVTDRDTQDEVGGTLIGVATRAEESAPSEQQAEVRQIRRELEEEYASWIPFEQARREMDQLGQSYVELRKLPSGTQRTMLMESVAGRMRALAPRAAVSPEDVNDYLQSGHQGKRLLGLSVLEWSGDTSHFDQVLQIIDGGSKSAFEQYHALRAVEKMLPRLDRTDSSCLREALNRQREYDESKKQWIRRGSDRWQISGRLLSAMDAV